MKNATEDRLKALIKMNLDGLKTIINYNIEHGITLYRISSGVIPFGSHPVNQVRWWEVFREDLEEIRTLICTHNLRVSMHPGQYTVLNSPKKEVIRNTIRDLEYHCRFLDAICDSSEHKLILHIGGVYGNKEKAIERFIENYHNQLSENIKKRLVIENDERNYNIEEVLYISGKTGAPAVFDNLHNAINGDDKPIKSIVERCNDTWSEKDGPQKIHYSQQDYEKKTGAHSETIDPAPFMRFIDEINAKDIDIMLEVKDKNKSTEKIMQVLQNKRSALEKEWAKNKYRIMERSYSEYKSISEMMQGNVNSQEFYDRINKSLDLPVNTKDAINSVQHVWGYFKRKALPKEKEQVFNLLEQYKAGNTPLTQIKAVLKELTIKYEVDYLKESYYFIQ